MSLLLLALSAFPAALPQTLEVAAGAEFARISAAIEQAEPAPAASADLGLAQALLAGRTAELQQALAQAAPSQRARATGLLAFALAIGGEPHRAAELARGLERGALSPQEQALLDAALSDKPVARAQLASASAPTPTERAMRMRWLAREAETAAKARQWKDAAQSSSDLLLQALEAPWPVERGLLAAYAAALRGAQEQYRWNPRADWPALEFEVQFGEGLQQIRKRAVAQRDGWKLCTGIIERANALTGPVRPGQKLRLPTDPVSVLVDIDERYVLVRMADEVVAAFEVAVGREGHETAPGRYEVGESKENPMWFPVGKEPVPFGDPANPLGTRWISWIPRSGGRDGLGFHGTNQPDTIGSAASDGCVRLRNEDVEQLYKLLPRGSVIEVRP